MYLAVVVIGINGYTDPFVLVDRGLYLILNKLDCTLGSFFYTQLTKLAGGVYFNFTVLLLNCRKGTEIY